MTLEEIKQQEDKENASFLNWIKSPSFQLQSHENRTTELEIYMIAKNQEIGNLQAMNAARAKKVEFLEYEVKHLKDALRAYGDEDIDDA